METFSCHQSSGGVDVRARHLVELHQHRVRQPADEVDARQHRLVELRAHPVMPKPTSSCAACRSSK